MRKLQGTMLAIGLSLLTPVALQAQDCADESLSGLRICTDPAAAAALGQPGWVGCQGRCLIAATADGISITQREGGEVTRFSGAYFLAGNGVTRDLAMLPLLGPEGRLILLDPDSLEPAAGLSLDGVVEGDPRQQPRFVEEARLSADGHRLFVPSPDGPGFAVWRITHGGLSPVLPNDPVMVVSVSGRYGLSVDPDGDGTYRLQDYERGLSLATPVRFEIDMPFFDVDETHLLRRHRYKAGPRLGVYDLKDMAQIANIAWPEGSGLDLRIRAGKTGITVEDLVPAPE
ncbi:hypothetical protein [Aurantiacibacter xanthus]|nr:hypothetical protein [Aurantiacibacter xanthus]